MARDGSKIAKEVPPARGKPPLRMGVTVREFNGRFRPRKETAKPSAQHYTKAGVLPAIQERRKPVLRGVYED